MVSELEQSLRQDSIPSEDLEARVSRLERTLALLISDKAIGNALKGPFRLPGHGNPAAFQ